jgi:hypothetical protein
MFFAIKCVFQSIQSRQIIADQQIKDILNSWSLNIISMWTQVNHGCIGVSEIFFWEFK